MTASTAAPETLLAGRYRLQRRRSADGDTGSGDLWRAYDEVLARPVAVRLVPVDDERAERLLSAAARAGRLSDSRLVRVLDAAEDDGFAFVVTEWVDGEPLSSLLRSYGPLEPERATAMVLAVARVLAAAHGQGLAHLRLHPRNVLLTSAGETKLTDLEIAAALAGVPEPRDPRAAEARGLGLLLYAALTARWPDAAAYDLPAAPVTDGRLASPRQVRAGVPRELDAVVERCLAATPRRGLDPIRSPSGVAAALAGLPQGRPDRGLDDQPLPRPPSRARQVLRVALPLVTIGGIVVAAWLSGLALGRVPGPGPGFASSGTATPAPGSGTGRSIPVPPDAIRDFDPEGDGKENTDQALYAVDGDTSTAWQTDVYRRRADLGGLKSGVGLVLDLGRPRRVAAVTVQLTQPGADLELRAGNTFADSAAAFPLVASATDAGSDPPAGAPRTSEVLRPEGPGGGPVRARYWVVWLTSLPQDGSDFRAGVAELTFLAPAGG